MKVAYGATYKEAIINRPLTGVRRSEFWEGKAPVRGFNAVVLDFKEVRRVSVHEWVRYKRFEVKIVDKRTNQLVVDEKTGEQLKFRSITQALKWIWKEDKEIYEKLENLSIKSPSSDRPTPEEGGKCIVEEELIF